MNDKIRFGIPIDIFKGQNSKGEEVYKFKGLASTNDKDNQGEQLFAKQFDLNDFKNVNYNHQGGKDANAVLGEITTHNFDRNGLNVEGELWGDMPMTSSVVALMKRKAKQGKKLQLSVEGQVLKRGSEDKKHPAYNKILKAKLTGVAVTLNPINGNTFCDLIEKGITNNEWIYSDEDELLMKSVEDGSMNENDDSEIEKSEDESKWTAKQHLKQAKIHEQKLNDAENPNHKTGRKGNINVTVHKEAMERHLKLAKQKQSLEKAMTTGSDTGTSTTNKPSNGSTLKQEDLESKKNLSNTLSKSACYSAIFEYFYPTIDFKKAGDIYKLTEKISKMEKKQISKETLNKAFEIIELAAKETSNEEVNEAVDLIKSDFNDLEKSEQVEELVKAGYDEEVAEEAADKHEEDSKDKKKKKKSASKKKKEDEDEEGEEEDQNFEKALNAIEEIQINSDMKFGALGVIIKSQSETIEKISTQLEDTTEALEKSNELLQKSFDLIEKISKTAVKFNRPVGGAAGVERFGESKESGNKTFNVKNKIQKAALVQTLDNLAGTPGSNNFNEDLLKAAADLEMVGVITNPKMKKYLSDVYHIDVTTSDED